MGRLGDFAVLSILLAMAVTTAISVITSYCFYRWRRILTLEGKVVTIPEELISKLAMIGNELSSLRSAIGTSGTDQKRQTAQIVQNIGKTSKAIAQLFETSVSLQSALDQRDTEINRLKQGYDTELIRRFVARFIRVKTALADAEASAATDGTTLHQIARLLDDALDECGVEEFRPKISEDFRTAAGVADNPRVVQTADSSQNFKIADVLEPGYRFRLGAKDNIILPARVSIYVARSSGA